MIRLLVPLALLPLVACAPITRDLSSAGKGAGMYFCAGQGSVSVVGQASMVSGNGSVTFNCGQGAYFGQGYPVGPLPTLPQLSQVPQIPNFPPIGNPPATAIQEPQ